ncbi:hypothetical protein [Shewanella cyperi]|uniref:hypothetical protein n=1 Tax=Shewanella cyperi TaxID=2814292 RepID=UPI001A941FE2|nr:hypothetical protein [Shewanella cyperi]QSX39977.1 hypothetical protein JYB84_13425 [Shewanella cyperi]
MMKWNNIVWIGLTALVAAQLPAGAEELKVYDTVLNFQLPDNWRQVGTDELGGMFSAEFLPQEQRLADWTSLVCVQGFHGMGDRITPQAFFETFTNNYKANCLGEMVYEPLGALEMATGEQSGFQAILGCSRMPDTHLHGEPSSRGEIGYYAVLGGGEDLLLMHKSMRGLEFTAANVPLNGSNYREFIAPLQPIKLNQSN